MRTQVDDKEGKKEWEKHTDTRTQYWSRAHLMYCDDDEAVANALGKRAKEKK